MKTQYDVIVIGGGVMGAAVTAQLAQSGRSVLLLERREPACGASGGNGGQTSLIDRCEPWHMKLALESLRYYREELGVQYPEMEYEEAGGSIVLYNQEQIHQAQLLLQRLQELRVPAKLYYGQDLLQAEPALNTGYALALLHCPWEGKLNPFGTVLSLLDVAQHHGAQLLRNAPVQSFEKSGQRITCVRTPAGEFQAEYVINCAGPWSQRVAQLAGVSIPILHHKGVFLATSPIAPLIRGPVNDGFFLTPESGPQPKRSFHFGVTQTAHGSILLGQATEECPLEDVSVNMPSLQGIAAGFLKNFPQLEELPVVRAWAAPTTYTPDGLPVFGFSSGAENFFTAAGFKGAFSTAPAVGRLVRDVLDGRCRQDCLPGDPDRKIST